MVYLPPDRSGTGREEGVANNLRRLPARGVVIGSEVRSVSRRHARLCRYAAAWVSAHHAARSKAFNEVVEGRANGDVLEGLSTDRILEPCSVSDYLERLASRGDERI